MTSVLLSDLTGRIVKPREMVQGMEVNFNKDKDRKNPFKFYK